MGNLTSKEDCRYCFGTKNIIHPCKCSQGIHKKCIEQFGHDTCELCNEKYPFKIQTKELISYDDPKNTTLKNGECILLMVLIKMNI